VEAPAPHSGRSGPRARRTSAVWAVGAFATGAWVRTGRWWPALAGVFLLLVAVESYFRAAMLALHDAPQTLWAASTLLWLVRTIRQRLARIALSVPLALAGFVTFALTGFGG
jgi:hypothetical protein